MELTYYYAYSYRDGPPTDADIKYEAYENVHSLGKIREPLLTAFFLLVHVSLCSS